MVQVVNAQKQYTLARNELHFASFLGASKLPNGFRYIGNTPEFSLGSEPETLDHFDADHGLKEKDDSVLLQLSRTGSFTTDNINVENLAAYFVGTASTVVQALAASQVYDIAGAKKGHSYQIGQTVANPTGDRTLTLVVVTEDIGSSPDTYVLGTDYSLNAETGLLTILDTATFPDGTDITVGYTKGAVSRDRIVAANDVTVEGALQVRAFNARGVQRDFFLPYVKMTPNGEINLKGDEWQVIPFTLEILSPGDGRASVYIDGRPYVVAP